MGIGYSRDRYGRTTRIFPKAGTKVDFATVGTLAEQYFNFPEKFRIEKIGVMSAASDCVSSTSTLLEIRTINGTKVASAKFTSHVTIGTGEATAIAVEDAATTITANRGYMFTMGTQAGLSGSIYPFIEGREQHVDGLNTN